MDIAIGGAVEVSRMVVHTIEGNIITPEKPDSQECAEALAAAWHKGMPGKIESVKVIRFNRDYNGGGLRIGATLLVEVLVAGEYEKMAAEIADLRADLDNCPAEGEIRVPTSTPAQRAAQKVADSMVQGADEDQRHFYTRRAEAYRAALEDYETEASLAAHESEAEKQLSEHYSELDARKEAGGYGML